MKTTVGLTAQHFAVVGLFVADNLGFFCLYNYVFFSLIFLSIQGQISAVHRCAMCVFCLKIIKQKLVYKTVLKVILTKKCLFLHILGSVRSIHNFFFSSIFLC